MNSQTPISLRDAVIVDDGMHRWQTLTSRANAAFTAGDLSHARSQYLQALELAEVMFGRPDGCACAIGAIYTISCHNLAEFAHHGGDCAEAGRYYRRAFDRLLQATHAVDAPLALRANCVTHLKHATVALVGYLQTCAGTPQQIAKVIAAARKASDRAAKAARHANTTPPPRD